MEVNVALAIILCVLLVVIGRERGGKTIVSFACNFGLFFLANHWLADGKSPIVVSFLVCVLASVVVLFLVNGYNQKTVAAFVSVMSVVVIMCVLVYVFVFRGHLQGYTAEQADTLMTYELTLAIDFRLLTVSAVIMSLIGALIDAAISITSAVYEVHQNNPQLSKKELMQSGMNMGMDILSTNANTLFFAFIAEEVAFCIWLKVYQHSFWDMINYKTFAREAITMLLSASGCVLILPIATWVCVQCYTRNK